jgi:hypothetical protein
MTVTPILGQPVWLYANSEHLGGMVRRNDTDPFAALVASVENDRLINVLAIDHDGSIFPLRSVPLFQGDDEDLHDAPCHCELKPPIPVDQPATDVSHDPAPVEVGGE